MINIQTTSNSKKILKAIAAELLNKKLTACTHISKISCSSYVWEGEVVSKKEYKLEVKTIKKYKNNVISIIKKNHNYEIFELLTLDISDLNSNYKKWFKEEIK